LLNYANLPDNVAYAQYAISVNSYIKSTIFAIGARNILKQPHKTKRNEILDSQRSKETDCDSREERGELLRMLRMLRTKSSVTVASLAFIF